MADGVYAAIATELGVAFSNAGLIDLGDQTLVFDAFENPRPAEDLLEASIQLTGRKPKTVIISHWHPDHWGGLQVFADCAILATPATRKAMLPVAKEMRQEQSDLSGLTDALRQTLPPPFDAWQGIGCRFDANVRGLFQRQRKET